MGLTAYDRCGETSYRIKILEEIITREEQIQNLDVGFAELVITAAWYIWWERRQLVHGETVQRPSRSAMAIAALT